MIRTPAIAAALAALVPAPAGSQDADDLEPLLVVAILAHPDDELPMAPALAALAREGSHVRLVYATPGDAGPGVSGLPKGEALAATRRGEAECSGRALGAAEVVHLDFGDGRLAEHMRDGSLAKALFDHVAGADMVLTWGPDGGYGHADHRLVSAVATQIAQVQPEESRPLVLYFGIPSGGTAMVPDIADWAETDPSLLTAGIAYTRADLENAAKAVRCHVTQFDPVTLTAMSGVFDASIWRGKVHFRPAF